MNRGPNSTEYWKLARPLAVLLSGVLSAGCVIVPLPKTEAPVQSPDVRPYLPRDVLESRAELLVLGQVTTLHHPSFIANRPTALQDGTSLDASFYAGTDLEQLKDSFKLKSSVRFFLLLAVIPNEADYTSTLRRLCLITADGRMFAFTPGQGDSWADVREGRLDTVKRAAIVANIRARNKTAGYSAEVPCSQGWTNWMSSLQSKVEEFLLRIPAEP